VGKSEGSKQKKKEGGKDRKGRSVNWERMEKKATEEKGAGARKGLPLTGTKKDTAKRASFY